MNPLSGSAYSYTNATATDTQEIGTHGSSSNLEPAEPVRYAVPHEQKVDVGEFSAQLRNLVLPMGLKVDEVRLTGEGVHFERKPFVFTVAKPGEMQVQVSEASLAEFLDGKSPAGLRKFQVRAEDGKLYVDAVKTVLVDLKASAVCALRIEEGSRLMVDILSVDVAGAGIKNLLQAQLDKINPIIDAADFPFPVILESVTAHEGVTLTGKVSPPTEF